METRVARSRPSISGVLATSDNVIDARISSVLVDGGGAQSSGLPPLAPFMPMQLLHTVDNQIRQLAQQRQASERRCSRCRHTGMFIERCHTSIPADGAPQLILLELPDDPLSELPYALNPTAVRSLPGLDASYRLAGVLLIKRSAVSHYFTMAFDPRERRWLCYDGMVANGVGQPADPPGGRVRGAYPILAMYARVRHAS